MIPSFFIFYIFLKIIIIMSHVPVLLYFLYRNAWQWLKNILPFCNIIILRDM